MATETNKAIELSTEAKAYNGVDRNAWILAGIRNKSCGMGV